VAEPVGYLFAQIVLYGLQRGGALLVSVAQVIIVEKLLEGVLPALVGRLELEVAEHPLDK
jgi:hypothetical protein